MTRAFTCSVNNPLSEEWAYNQAKHDFMLANSFVWNDWQKFCPKSITDMTMEEYAELTKEFYKRIKVVKAVPTVKVIDGYYRVVSVIVSMEYNSN